MSFADRLSEFFSLRPAASSSESVATRKTVTNTSPVYPGGSHGVGAEFGTDFGFSGQSTSQAMGLEGNIGEESRSPYLHVWIPSDAIPANVAI